MSGESGADISGVGVPRIRYPLDPNADSGASEYSWGAGLTVPGYEQAPPSAAGGRHHGLTPEEKPRVSVSKSWLI